MLWKRNALLPLILILCLGCATDLADDEVTEEELIMALWFLSYAGQVEPDAWDEFREIAAPVEPERTIDQLIDDLNLVTAPAPRQLCSAYSAPARDELGPWVCVSP